YVRFHEDISGKNINFLIGSGTSFPFIKTLSLGRNKPSLEELLTNGNIKINAKYLVFYYYYHNWIVKMFMENEETSEYRQVFQNYEKFIKNGLNILRTEGYQNPKRMNIFTTNYDLFFENVFDSLVLENPLNFFNDGSRGFIDKYINIENYHLNVAHSGVQDNYKKEIPSFNLVKLHGSVSWQNTLQGIKVEYNEESILEKHQDLKIYIDKIEEIINNQNSEEEMINSINMLSEEINEQALLDFYAEYKKLAIINPTKYKFSQTVFEQHYYQMLRFLSYELERKNTILIVVGFSFADEHIKEIVGRSLSNPYLKIYIVCYDLHQRY
ncbi:TPA: SIR2 family protein, partial [Listeria monocytogenes]|nr:SIR2 family protein [Listeria monocytogenes]